MFFFTLFISDPFLTYFDRRAYCSDKCQNLDTASPSISSASSTFSSPRIPYTLGNEVPALIPSALGSAFTNYSHNRNRHSISSSSASSTAWSLLTDSDDDDALVSEYSSQADGTDSMYEGSSKSASFLHSMHTSALSYARRPSGTNNRTTIPYLHRRTSSGSSSGHVRGIPRSAPSHSSAAEEDEYHFDFGFDNDRNAPENEKNLSIITTKEKRSRNRASLPAHFSLLQLSGSPIQPRSSPSSSGTAVRPSPTTPRLPLPGVCPYSSTSLHPTPRGRGRQPGSSRSSRRSDDSISRSRSRPLKLTRIDGVEPEVDWSKLDMNRGRPAVRRNSSPPPKMLLSSVALEDHHRLNMTSGPEDRSRERPKTRGRARMDGQAPMEEAPGYGNGRSGLLHRQRASSRGATGPR